ncbi:MAG TPA: SDR family oxidoreductase [Actinomycetota bacterium]|nr:SDR family oxidoreductase [Actinomycetota bacterium]
MRLRGAVVVVTGASSGIGWETALAFAKAGATVVGAARRKDRLDRLAGAIEQGGGTALAVECDVADRDQVEGLRRAVDEAFGRCDVLVNNAGVAGGGPFTNVSVDQIERVVRTNYLGVLYCTKAFLPGMLKARRGHIVNVASLAGRYAVPGSSVYSSTKHAVVAFSEALYYELASQGVRVTTVNPSFVRTEGFSAGDMEKLPKAIVLDADQVAGAIVDVVKKEKAPEVSVPRWMASMQSVRVLAPPLYRAALRRMSRRGMSTRKLRAD